MDGWSSYFVPFLGQYFPSPHLSLAPSMLLSMYHFFVFVSLDDGTKWESWYFASLLMAKEVADRKVCCSVRLLLLYMLTRPFRWMTSNFRSCSILSSVVIATFIMISFCTFMARALYGFHAGTPGKNIFSQTIYFEKRGMRSGTVTAVILIIQSMISCSWIIPYCYQSWACYGVWKHPAQLSGCCYQQTSGLVLAGFSWSQSWTGPTCSHEKVIANVSQWLLEQCICLRTNLL